MAYAAAASLSHTINVILDHHQQSISPLFKTQITYLHEHVIFLRSFLEDFPDEARVWEGRMREATNEAEDIIELLLSTVLGSSGPKLERAKYEIPDYFDELERVIKEIDLVVQEVKGHTKIVDAVDNDLEEIISQLRGGSSALESIPIVGSGGTGKTTLASRAYNHRLIVKHFWIRGWITVSNNYRHHGCRGIILSLLLSMNELTSEVMLLSDEELLRRLFEILHGTKYLIVLDDLWSAEVWEWLKDKIPVDFNGSRILITSRLLDVACCAGFYSRVHKMSLMNANQSWNLLRNKIFKGDACPPQLEYIGKMIAGSCRGVPLAIEVVSGVLAANLSPAAWEDFLENIKSQPFIDCNDDEHVLGILHLCYIYLPHHLRPCFLYLGIFQEDQVIHASNLIRLWEAEGFLNQSESQSFGETGEEHLEDLARRSLISVIMRKSSGKVKNFRIHDLVREMCIRQAHLDNLFVHVGGFLAAAEAGRPKRRVSVVDPDDNFLKNVCNSTIRTMICLKGTLVLEGMQRWLEHPRLLRILDFSKTYHSSNLSCIPRQLFQLFPLRYLAFNYPCSSIPKAILNLEALQTLVIGSKNQRSVIKLPVEIWRMPLLKHIVVHSCELPSVEGTFCLENLQTLTEALDFSIGSREALRMIPNLKKLGVSCRVETDILLENLIYLGKLEILKIRTFKYFLTLARICPLAFHPTLKKLSLRNVGFIWEDMKVVGRLPNLQVLKLRTSGYEGNGSIWETSEGGFCKLEFLHIEAPELKHWITKSSHFPRLKRLVIRSCFLLEVFPDDLVTLESIELDGFCNSSLLRSARRIRDQQKILGINTLTFPRMGAQYLGAH